MSETLVERVGKAIAFADGDDYLEHQREFDRYSKAAVDELLKVLADRLCSTPLIEDLAFSASYWESCGTVQDVYDMTKRKIRAAFDKIRSGA